MTVASAVGYLSMLEEPVVQVQAAALSALDSMINSNWHEMVGSMELLVSMAQSGEYNEQHLAALICSKLYFHLGDLDKAVSFALLAGDKFRLDSVDTEYVDVVLSKAVEVYIQARLRPHHPSPDTEPQQLLEALIGRLVDKCLHQQQEFVHVVGIGLECRRLDLLDAAIKAVPSEDQKLGLIYYIVDMSSKLAPPFKQELLNFAAVHLRNFPSPDHVAVADCLIQLDDAHGLADLIQRLHAGGSVDIALQICFNVSDNAGCAVKTALMAALKDVQLLHDALSGEAGGLLRLHFLSKSIASDLLILERTRTQFNPANSMFHSAVALAHGILHSGTTNDDFIRKNMEWLTAATNWTKFTAVSSLGSVYRGHRQQSRQLLSQYLPKQGVVGSEFSEAGSLFALGLIHCGFPQDKWVLDYLLDTLNNGAGNSEVLQHGCCYGIGAAGLASARDDAVEDVKAKLFADNAVAGEAAAVALGMLKFGTADLALIQDLLSYTKETKHDKIVRGLCISVALVLFGHPEAGMDTATGLLEGCSEQEGGWMRFCAVWILALSHAGTGSREALKLLLRSAVSDANQDVRRASVIAMSFVLIGRPAELPEMVRLLMESYNPNVRFGALIALGVGFAGTGDPTVLDMIDALMRSDKTDYVRQAAMMAAAMVLMQQSEKSQLPLRQHLERTIATKHEEALARFGAVLSQGILDAGGRNQCISMSLPSGQVDPLAVVGMTLFCQYWFWFPNASFLSLALRPTALIAVSVGKESGALQCPVMTDVCCEAKQSLFAYPAPIKGDKEVAPVKLVTAVLSTASQTGNDAGSAKATPAQSPAGESPNKDAEEDVPMEADSFPVANFGRVTCGQAKHVHFNARFLPVARFHPRMIAVVADSRPGEPCEFVQLVDPVAEDSKPVEKI